MNTTRILVYVPGALTWFTIIGLPICIGLALHVFLLWTIVASWGIGILAFVVCLGCGEWLLRGLSQMLVTDPGVTPLSITREERIADIISQVLTHEETCYSSVAQQLDVVSTNPLCQEAIGILKSCANGPTRPFSQYKLRMNQSRLVQIMDLLRAE